MSEETPMSEGAGFEPETGDETVSEGIGARRDPMVRNNKAAVRKANIAAVFGQGPGRLAIIFVGIFIAVAFALGLRGCTSKKAVEKTTASIDVPQAPDAQVSTKPVSADEAKRHADQARKEAQAAQAEGKDYQASFDPNISKQDKVPAANANAQNAGFDLPSSGDTTHGNRAPGVSNITPIGGTTAATSGATDNNASGDSANTNSGNGANAAPTQAQLDAEKKHQDEYAKAITDRDTYVNKYRDRVLNEADEILGNNKDQAKSIGYQSFDYPSGSDGNIASSGGTATSNSDAKGGDAKTQTSEPKGPPIFKTGNTLYMTSNSLVNTDHGGQLFATVRGGDWNGSQVICDIQQAPDNIRAHCTTLAPQDNRQTLKIDAVVLRESDMAQGIAEHIDHHIISRYSALAVSSLLQGYGEAYSYQQGTSVVTSNGTVLQTSEAPSNKQVIGRAVGQMGTNVAGEVQKGFDRPTTYSTPANQGLILYFLADVYPTSS